MRNRRTLLMTLVVIACVIPSVLFARKKTDIVVLKNGDHLTGEIKQLDRGILKLSTDDIGTINIEWVKVDSLNSVYQFRVETRLAEKYFGSIFLGRSGDLEVIREGRVATVGHTDVVAITPLEAGFWQRLDGSFSVGFSYTKSNKLAQLSSDVNIRYRTPLRQVILDASTISTSQTDKETTRRADVSLTYNRLFHNRWFVTTSASGQSNDELGLDLRLNFAPGVGVDMIQSNHNSFTSTLGLNVNREWSSNNQGDYNLEGFFGLEFATFRSDSPKTNITLTGIVYPGLTTWGRIRSEVDVNASRELISDLTFVLTFYHSSDSDPVDPNAAHTDYGLVSSLAYTF